MKKILTARYVLPVTAPPIERGAILVEDGKILSVGTLDEVRGVFKEAEVDDLGDAALMPGLVNCHSHLELTVMRGLLDRHDDDFGTWLTTLAKARAERFSETDISNAALAGAIEGARAGVTCFGDIGRIGSHGHSSLRRVGLRGIVYQETEFAPDDRQAGEAFQKLTASFEILRKSDTALVRSGLSPHSPYTVSEPLCRQIAEFSVADSIPVTIHLSESNHEEELLLTGRGFFSDVFSKHGVEWTHKGRSATHFLNDTGLLRTGTLLAHCVKVSDADLKIISDSGASIAHCPKSNAKFGHGVAPLAKFTSRLIKTGVGSDSVASNNTVDLFEEVRFALLFARTGDVPLFIDAAGAIRLMTLGGAQALGLESEIGSLEPGKRADIIAVSLSAVSQRPINDVESSIVFSSGARDVILTMVDGEEIYRDGRILTVDESEILKSID